MIEDGDGGICSMDGSPGHAQSGKRLGRGHLVNEMAINI
jgi:hypothetical protein